ncbi:Uu.00g009070.m01.CDS01 [Anthostomella pinea]|uniref:Uu.00g009070.m01.CDS01 n=1 Tax=Anthostomella pinea TaxID=933095 RepID=A0AAI8VXB9_9PEZI|nr:Uu.00g009070.m01.CDS01 [Anthostomella pinea]
MAIPDVIDTTATVTFSGRPSTFAITTVLRAALATTAMSSGSTSSSDGQATDSTRRTSQIITTSDIATPASYDKSNDGVERNNKYKFEDRANL